MTISRSLSWGVASIFYAYQYILRVMPNIMLPDIMGQFDMSASTFGQFSGIYYIGYSLIHLPIGILLDRFGPKKVMTACILCTVLGLTPLIFAENWVYPVAGRLLIGIGSSAAILGVFKIIRIIFSAEKFSRILSLSVTIGLIGAIYGGAPVSYMRDQLGYKAVVQIFAVAGIFLAMITYFLVPNVKKQPEKTVLGDIKEVITNAQVVWSCLFAGMMVGPLEGFADVWGTVFLKQTYGFEGTIAASMPSMIFIGMCFGAPLLSIIADTIGSYLATIIAAGGIMAVCFASMLIWEIPLGMLTFYFLIVGVCCAYQILAIYKASTYVREQVVGLTTAIANMIIMIFGYAFHSIIGSIVNLMGGPTSSKALICGTAIIPFTLVIGVGGYIVLAILEKKKVQVS